MLMGGFRELARVGIGNGGSLWSGRLGLRARPACVAIPFWIMAALRITLDRLELAVAADFSRARAMDLSDGLLVAVAVSSRMSRDSGSENLL